jgi:hypothetical protein
MSSARVKKTTNNLAVIWLAIMLVFIAELFAYTWCRVQSIRVGYAIAAENRRYQHQGVIRKKLTVELAHMKSPKRVEALGRQLGLVTPSARQIVVMK